jgi:hypothetical protein
MINEAISKENWERMEQGLPPLKSKKAVIPDPPKPVIPNELKLTDIPPNCDIQLDHAKRNTVRNEDGLRFIGFDVTITCIPKKKKPGKPPTGSIEEPVTLSGWMQEGEFLSFVRTYRAQIGQQAIHW